MGICRSSTPHTQTHTPLHAYPPFSPGIPSHPHSSPAPFPVTLTERDHVKCLMYNAWVCACVCGGVCVWERERWCCSAVCSSSANWCEACMEMGRTALGQTRAAENTEISNNLIYLSQILQDLPSQLFCKSDQSLQLNWTLTNHLIPLLNLTSCFMKSLESQTCKMKDWVSGDIFGKKHFEMFRRICLYYVNSSH